MWSRGGAYSGPYSAGQELGGPPVVIVKERRRRSCGEVFCLWLCCVIVLCIVAIGILSLITWLVIHPKDPSFNLTSVNLYSFSIKRESSGLSAENSLNSFVVSAHLGFVAEVHNPNKVSISYDGFNVTLLYSEERLGSTWVAPFHQPKYSNHTVTGVFYVSDLPLLVGANLLEDSADGSVRLQLKAKVKVRVSKLFHVKVKVSCDMDVNVLSKELINQHCKARF